MCIRFNETDVTYTLINKKQSQFFFIISEHNQNKMQNKSTHKKQKQNEINRHQHMAQHFPQVCWHFIAVALLLHLPFLFHLLHFFSVSWSSQVVAVVEQLQSVQNLFQSVTTLVQQSPLSKLHAALLL